MDARMETLLTVYETRNFTKAARQLSLTQPAVSQHIKQLEHDLDTILFIRGEKGLKPTAEGAGGGDCGEVRPPHPDALPESGSEPGGREAQCDPPGRGHHPLLREQRHSRSTGCLHEPEPGQSYNNSF